MGDISKDIQSKFVNNKVKAMLNIIYTANWINSVHNAILKPYGVSPQQFNILRILRGANKPLKVQDIKTRMIERAPNATRLMDKLCDKDLIARVPCAEDRRVVHIEIKPEGLNLLKNIEINFNDDLLDNLSEEDAGILSDLLDKIR